MSKNFARWFFPITAFIMLVLSVVCACLMQEPILRSIWLANAIFTLCFMGKMAFDYLEDQGPWTKET